MKKSKRRQGRNITKWRDVYAAKRNLKREQVLDIFILLAIENWKNR
jgi:hypothetical protein